MPTGLAHSALYFRSESLRPFFSQKQRGPSQAQSQIPSGLINVKTLGDACKDPENDSGIKYHVCFTLDQVSIDDRIPGNKIISNKRFEIKTSKSISSPNKRSELQLIKVLPISSLGQARWMVDGGWWMTSSQPLTIICLDYGHLGIIL